MERTSRLKAEVAKERWEGLDGAGFSALVKFGDWASAWRLPEGRKALDKTLKINFRDQDSLRAMKRYTDHYRCETKCRPPFAGLWRASIDKSKHHRKKAYAVYALDLLKVGRDMKRHDGKGRKVEDWFSWDEPVYAVADGVVKAVLTTSGQYHWRVAIGGPGSGTTQGHLYAHLRQSSIAVNVGDTVVAGQYLGDLVPWPTSNFTHVHFNSLEDRGNQWFGDWLVPNNVHEDLEHVHESSAPVFENARGNGLFAFCRNETSNYLNPNSLNGKVDIIAHVGDRLNSSWTCSVQTLRYSIYPAGNPGAPVVDNKLSVHFDMALDTYGSGTIDGFLVDLLYKEDSTCNTDGDYNSREFFHILTNSNGDRIYDAADQNEAWDTNAVPNGDYVIEAVAIDAAGNRSTASMTVTVSN